MLTDDLPVCLTGHLAAWWDTSAVRYAEFYRGTYFALRSRYGGGWRGYNRMTYGTYGSIGRTVGGLFTVGGVATANPKLQSTNVSGYPMGTASRTAIVRFCQTSPGYVASFGKYEIDKWEGIDTTDGTLVIDRVDAGSNINTGVACGNGQHTVVIAYESGVYEIRLDGVTVAVESRTAVTPGLTKVGLLGACDLTSVHAVGTAGEILLWTRKLSPREMVIAESYLARKWQFI